ncbi:hypothetical protein BVC93_17840 [Mycobacterium sp. MS1601]|uniref:DUF4245 domain-containing protein n=1 Tax=Mycobacterium sp. MS1601 TaxID=1936029 RepID=UPI0009791165|nr:DUF4245 domain-containing protein [Mycobacterium sp. MS1601]AQA06485.1 hypothetical protein BVC93_17840 [Mycobacterium sp. MS1601]
MTTEPQQTPGDAGQAVPALKEAKPRLLQDGRDMFWSMAPLVLGCILLAGLLGMCSFQPSGPTQGSVPTYDAEAALGSDAQTLGFPVRLPKLPEGWQANSGKRDGLDSARTDPATGQRTRALLSNVGYLTPDTKFMSLTQSNADEDRLVASILPGAYPTGAVDVGGRQWVVYQAVSENGRDEPLWTTRIGSTQLAITGAGSPEQFHTLAEATQSQSPLPDA